MRVAFLVRMLTVGVGVFLSSAPAEGQFVIGGPAASLTSSSTSWSWDGGTNVLPFRNALTDVSHFGAGPVPIVIQTANLSTIDAAALAPLDAFVASWWKDTDAPPAAVAAVVQWFQSGGHLILFQDSSTYDPIGEALGVPTFAGSNATPSNGVEPFFDGPFGTAAGVLQWGSTGQLNPVDIAAHNGHVGGTNTSGEVTSAYWNAGEYGPGCGRLVVIADIDMVSNQTATYAPLNENGKFGLNAVAFLAGVGSNVRYYGEGCPGSGGFTPKLVVLGDATPGTAFGLKLEDALGGSLAMVLFGAIETSVPIGLSGCSLLVAPVSPFQPIVPIGGAGPGNGTFTLAAAMPLGSSGLVFTSQMLVQDSLGLAGFTATGGVEVTVP
ncbi:MAG: hypothetical protein ACF8XB_10400 [Planctomycetota bacterium JB042]